MRQSLDVQSAGTHGSRLTPEEFSFISDLAKREFGLNLTPAKMPLVHSRISKRMRELGLTEFGAYRRMLEARDSAEEETKLLTALTTNVTSFFRENHHFEHLKRVAPQLLANAKRSRSKLRVWSAACSTGQEPFSVAMSLAAVCTDTQFHDVEIVGSDIDPNVIEVARSATYPNSELASIPKGVADRFTQEASNDRFQIRNEVRRKVSFGTANLVKASGSMQMFDFIFCRNAAIYFDQETQAHLWEKLARSLKPGGYLYIGHSERIHGKAANMLQNSGVTIYTRV